MIEGIVCVGQYLLELLSLHDQVLHLTPNHDPYKMHMSLLYMYICLDNFDRFVIMYPIFLYWI